MATELQVEIVTPVARAYSGPATEVIIPAWQGEIGILPDHDGLLALLKAGRCRVYTPEGEKRYIIGRGFAEIGPTRVTLLTDSCEPVDDIDKDAATEDLREAEEALGTADPTSEAYRQAKILEEHAKARLGL